MRFIIYGAGAIGATIGARLQQSGQEVILIARGAHARALRERGLRLESHAGVEQLAVQVIEHPAELGFRVKTSNAPSTASSCRTSAMPSKR
jgi:2-dehydropantoate 2-reductase